MSEMFFGIEATQIPDYIDEKNDFARCLFFSQALTSPDVFFILQIIRKLNEDVVRELYLTLKNEIEGTRKSRLNLTMMLSLDYCKSLYDKSQNAITPLEKYITWENYFSKLTNTERSDYFTTFRIYNTESEQLLQKHHIKTFKKPKDIYDELCKYVKGQEDAKKSMSFAFYLHLIRIRKIVPEIYNITNVSRRTGDIVLPDPHIMLIGPTGAGKTHIIRTLCRMYDIPFVKMDCAQMVSAGYVGTTIDDALTSLLLKAQSPYDAERGVVFFDEFDKVSEMNTVQGNVGGVSLQQEFLSIIEGGERMVKKSLDRYADYKTFETKNLLLVFSGSFAGIERFIENRNNKNAIGFKPAASPDKSDSHNILKNAMPQDFIDFGMIPELVGRINYYIALEELSKATLMEIIKNTNDSYLNAYENFFWIHYDKLIIDEEVCEMIADMVIQLKLGARPVRSILQKLLAEALFQSPNVIMETFHITKEDFIKTFNK